jgi:hypothetical protein
MLRLPSSSLEDEPAAKRMRLQSPYLGEAEEVEIPWIRVEESEHNSSAVEYEVDDWYWDASTGELWHHYEGLGWHSADSGWWRGYQEDWDGQEDQEDQEKLEESEQLMED